MAKALLTLHNLSVRLTRSRAIAKARRVVAAGKCLWALELCSEWMPMEAVMKNVILALPLTQVMRPQIALSLQQLLKIYTVGGLLNAWKSPRSQRETRPRPFHRMVFTPAS